jgi:ketosteroid isomerase-like protein
MSQENVEVARRAMRAFFSQDVEGWVRCCHPDIELLLPRNLLEGGSYRGIDGARRAFADAYDMWEELHFDLQDTRTVDDYVVTLGRSTNVGKGDAPTVEFEVAHVSRVREGKLVYFRPYQSHRDALEAVGLSE